MYDAYVATLSVAVARIEPPFIARLPTAVIDLSPQATTEPSETVTSVSAWIASFPALTETVPLDITTSACVDLIPSPPASTVTVPPATVSVCLAFTASPSATPVESVPVVTSYAVGLLTLQTS